MENQPKDDLQKHSPKYCPLNPGYRCMEDRCAWWFGNQCVIAQLLSGLAYIGDKLGRIHEEMD